MKRFLSLCFVLLALLTLSVPAFAEEDSPPDWLVPDFVQPETAEEDPTDPEPVQTLTPETEREGAKNETAPPPALTVPSTVPVDTSPAGEYPAGSYVDPAGNVYSPSGTRLSPEAAEALPVAALPSPASDVLDRADDGGTVAVEAPPVWYVSDLRPADSPVQVPDGLKALVTSIFGEYTPITTTTVITETVGNETRQYLVETVASGSAGVDYEWIAGVVLFAILLFCFMRLLGGVLK